MARTMLGVLVILLVGCGDGAPSSAPPVPVAPADDRTWLTCTTDAVCGIPAEVVDAVLARDTGIPTRERLRQLAFEHAPETLELGANAAVLVVALLKKDRRLGLEAAGEILTVVMKVAAEEWGEQKLREWGWTTAPEPTSAFARSLTPDQLASLRTLSRLPGPLDVRLRPTSPLLDPSLRFGSGPLAGDAGLSPLMRAAITGHRSDLTGSGLGSQKSLAERLRELARSAPGSGSGAGSSATEPNRRP